MKYVVFYFIFLLIFQLRTNLILNFLNKNKKFEVTRFFSVTILQ